MTLMKLYHYFIRNNRRFYTKLIKGGNVYIPEGIGKQDVLIEGEHIIGVAPNINIPNDLEAL